MSAYWVGAWWARPRRNVAPARVTPAISIHVQHTPNASRRAIGNRKRPRTPSATSATGNQTGVDRVSTPATTTSAGTVTARRRNRSRTDRCPSEGTALTAG